MTEIVDTIVLKMAFFDEKKMKAAHKVHDKFILDLYKAIDKHYPQLRERDQSQNCCACAGLAIVLGQVMAIVKECSGDLTYLQGIQWCVNHITDLQGEPLQRKEHIN